MAEVGRGVSFRNRRLELSMKQACFRQISRSIRHFQGSPLIHAQGEFTFIYPLMIVPDV